MKRLLYYIIVLTVVSLFVIPAGLVNAEETENIKVEGLIHYVDPEVYIATITEIEEDVYEMVEYYGGSQGTWEGGMNGSCTGETILIGILDLTEADYWIEYGEPADYVHLEGGIAYIEIIEVECDMTFSGLINGYESTAEIKGSGTGKCTINIEAALEGKIKKLMKGNYIIENEITIVSGSLQGGEGNITVHAKDLEISESVPMPYSGKIKLEQ